jgi:hypothetical protein
LVQLFEGESDETRSWVGGECVEGCGEGEGKDCACQKRRRKREWEVHRRKALPWILWKEKRNLPMGEKREETVLRGKKGSNGAAQMATTRVHNNASMHLNLRSI